MGLPNSRLTVWSYTFNFCWINYLIIEWHYSFFPWQPTDEAVNETSNNQQTDSMLFAGSLCGPLSESLNESMFILIISRWRLAFDSLKETNDTTLLSAAGSLVKIMVICFSPSPMFLFFIHSSMSWLESCMFPLQTCWWNWLGILLRIKCCLLHWIWNYQPLWLWRIFSWNSHNLILLISPRFSCEIFQNLGFEGLPKNHFLLFCYLPFFPCYFLCIFYYFAFSLTMIMWFLLPSETHVLRLLGKNFHVIFHDLPLKGSNADNC